MQRSGSVPRWCRGRQGWCIRATNRSLHLLRIDSHLPGNLAQFLLVEVGGIARFTHRSPSPVPVAQQPHLPLDPVFGLEPRYRSVQQSPVVRDEHGILDDGRCGNLQISVALGEPSPTQLCLHVAEVRAASTPKGTTSNRANIASNRARFCSGLADAATPKLSSATTTMLVITRL